MEDSAPSSPPAFASLSLLGPARDELRGPNGQDLIRRADAVVCVLVHTEDSDDGRILWIADMTRGGDRDIQFVGEGGSSASISCVLPGNG